MNQFIAIEGIDASGKATQSKLLSRYLGAELFSFPNYRTTTGKLIKSYLKGEWTVEPTAVNINVERNNALIFQSLQYTNRLEASDSIFNALSRNHVVADRYSVSGEVYGKAEGLNPEYLEKLANSLAVTPDIQILIDIPVEESFRRRLNRQGDRYEEDIKLLKRVRNNYLKIFKERQENDYSCSYFIVDGTGTIGEVQTKIQRIIDENGIIYNGE